MNNIIKITQVPVVSSDESNPNQPVRITLGENKIYPMSGQEADDLFIAVTVALATAKAMAVLGQIDVKFTIRSENYVTPTATAEGFLKQLGAVYGKWKSAAKPTT